MLKTSALRVPRPGAPGARSSSGAVHSSSEVTGQGTPSSPTEHQAGPRWAGASHMWRHCPGGRRCFHSPPFTGKGPEAAQGHTTRNAEGLDIHPFSLPHKHPI